MGSIVKVTMPLLSTLAALVIIVHTAEENYERDYREVRRALDVEPPNYDQVIQKKIAFQNKNSRKWRQGSITT